MQPPASAFARPVALDTPEVYHLPHWGRMSEQQRVKFLRDVAERTARDPRLRNLVAGILRQAGVEQRQYQQQAAALLKWVQQNIQYINEPGEILQDPLYTLQVKHGDCDDMASLLAAMFEAIRLTWRYVLAGKDKNGGRVRWIEGEQLPRNVNWVHIYLMVAPPFVNPETTRWWMVEPTVKRAPLGWEVGTGPLPGSGGGIPELGARAMGNPFGAGATPISPGASAAASTASAMSSHGELIQTIVVATVVGVTTSVLATVVLDYLHDVGIYKRRR